MSSEISKNSEKLIKFDSLDRNIVEEIIDGFSNVDLDEIEVKLILSDIRSLDICKNEDVYKSLAVKLMLKSNLEDSIINVVRNGIDIHEKPNYSNLLDILEYKNREDYDNITKKINERVEYNL